MDWIGLGQQKRTHVQLCSGRDNSDVDAIYPKEKAKYDYIRYLYFSTVGIASMSKHSRA